MLGVVLSLFFGFIPVFFYAWLIYWIDRYEKEPKILLGVVFLWGVIVAAGGAFLINTTLGIGIFLITGSETTTDLATGSLIAPIVEETLKGLAVLLVFFMFYKEFDSILDGIIYAAITALGFAATENSYYIYTYGFEEGGYAGLLVLAFVRVILVGWQHPFYTAFIGIGLAIARLNRSWIIKILAPLFGLMIAIATHSLHNTLASLLSGILGLLAGTMIDWAGWLGMFILILWMLAQEQRNLAKQLSEEAQAGILTQAQYKAACSAWRQSAARFGALFSGNFRATSRFYQLCGELAHKKYQFQKIGDEGGNLAAIDRLRNELAALSRQAQA